jgi:hypothetical protein
MMEAMTGGPPREEPVAQATITKPGTPPGRTKLPPAPRWEGMPVIDAHGQVWRAWRDLSRQRGQPSHEQPPYDMSPFGTAIIHNHGTYRMRLRERL